MKYHLATSFNLQTWNKDRINLVIGNNFLDERAKMPDGYKYILINTDRILKIDLDQTTNEVFKNISTIFPDLCKSLNEFHKTNLSKRHWNLLLGHWFFRCITTLLYRYMIIEKILNCNIFPKFL